MTGGGDGAKPSPLVSLLAGGIAGGSEAAITYPFEFAKTRVQLKNESGVPTSQNPFRVVGDVIKNEGFRSMYKGCSSLVAGTIAKDGIRFVFFDRIKDLFRDSNTGRISPLGSLFAGMSAGVLASIFAVTPAERIKTAMIDDARSSGPRRFKGTLHCIRTLVADNGITAVYRGFVTTTLKSMGTTSARLGSYSILKEYESARDIPQTTATNFANGAVAGTFTTYATQPFDVLKTRAQSAKGAGTVEAFQSVISDYGIKGLWKGTTMRLGRTVFAGGILFTVYEQVVAILNPLIPF